jgi:hypothetical protein
MLTNDERPPSATKTLRLTRSWQVTPGHTPASSFVIRHWSFVGGVTATLYDV